MYKPVQECTHCGAGLTLDDLRKPNCTYCGTVYPHHSMAAQHAQVMGQMMGQMMGQQAHIQNQWRAGFGVGPMPPPPGAPGSPYGDPNLIAQAHFQQAQRMSRGIMMVVLFSVLGVFLLVGGIMAMAFLL